VNLFHGFSGIPHGVERFLVYVCGFNGIDLLLYLGYLCGCLFEGVFVLLFAAKCGFGGYISLRVSIFWELLGAE
jgi:hypothetical protein